MSNFTSTKLIELGSCAFRQHGASHSHCRFVHGYQLKAKFYFTCKELDSNNWSVDFGGLKKLREILNNQFDHTLCVAETDPLLEDFKNLHQKGGCDLRIMSGVGIEKTAEWCFNAAAKFLYEVYGDRCWVEKVEVYEHENNSAIYHKDYTVDVSERNNNTLPVTVNVTSPIQPAVTPTVNLPAAVGSNKVTTGYSGLFDNISWGRK